MGSGWLGGERSVRDMWYADNILQRERQVGRCRRWQYDIFITHRCQVGVQALTP